nr:16S rRNA (cytidine(1402)-2'-O)-methyltransferase [Paraneptunicella aestuarii]
MSLGKLFIVATPIGNLEDITYRAISTLQQVDVVAAEDTRHSQKLLQHYAISTPMMSLHDHNEKQRASHLIEKLKSGASIALISDAGTPLISDPGYHLVNLCRQEGIDVVPIPGASAVITAMCASGLATDQFSFRGFLPVKQVAKQQALEVLADEIATCVFYESPRRVEDTLTVIRDLYPDRHIVIAKELTKQYETFVSGTAQDGLDWLAEDPAHSKGEFVLLIAGADKGEQDIPAEALSLLTVLAEEMPLKKAAAVVAKHYDLKKNQLYQIGLSMK